MKKFEFSLKKLLDYKEQILNKEKNSLSELKSKKNDAEKEIAEITELLQKANDKYIIETQKGMSAQNMITSKRHLNSLTDKIFQLKKIIAIYEEKIEKQLVVVIDATKEVNTVQKLEEKQRAEYDYECKKSEQLFIQELIINQKSNIVKV